MIKNTKKTKTTATKATPTITVAKRVDAAKVAPASAARAKLPKANNRVSLELVKPEAKAVYVAGSFNGWSPEKSPLLNTGDGHWVGDLAVGPGRYEYLFVVDGAWLPDPNAPETVQNPFGGMNSVLLVSE
jgi:1,4-alpha-glucan branching enzyme